MGRIVNKKGGMRIERRLKRKKNNRISSKFILTIATTTEVKAETICVDSESYTQSEGLREMREKKEYRRGKVL
jgi:hypothetical protein